MTNELGGLDRILGYVAAHEDKMSSSMNLIPSENLLTPAARLPYLSDAYSRYFFDEREVFGKWSFQGGSIIGEVQREVLVPRARQVTGAEFVDVRGISGLNAMTVALAAFGKPDQVTITVPPRFGGHPATATVARQLGHRTEELPFANWQEVDLPQLGELVARTKPALVYLDQATALCPLDLAGIIGAVRAESPSTHVHVDTSHVNALVWAGLYPHPLECGADSYGGSTHKTFPGPHKAMLLTNDERVSDQLTGVAVNLVSHHHVSDVIALAIAMEEFAECGGAEYAQRTVANAAAFASRLAEFGNEVQRLSADGPPTRTHQVWFVPTEPAHPLADRLFDAGIVVNPYNPLPSTGDLGIRMGLNEPTKLGLVESGAIELADLFYDVVQEKTPAERMSQRVADFRHRLSPSYCFPSDVVEEKLRDLTGVADPGISKLVDWLYR